MCSSHLLHENIQHARYVDVTHTHTHQGGETPRDKNCQTGAGPVLESSLLVRSSHARYFYDLPDLGTSYYSSPEGGREGGRVGFGEDHKVFRENERGISRRQQGLKGKSKKIDRQ